ncbi:hypothetical protein D9758_011241 [Tetrapyrgos nigripes]|uniref:beta-mannosidase n=1 Tax=Tetrapyrgos nigripes TaxID=182062 RepID=A0A8H5D941_9AGAR|nr:hypothetical protein D9758_011241 [Tetrapyrgos nigripes]
MGSGSTQTEVLRMVLDSGWEWKQRDTGVADVLEELQLPHNVDIAASDIDAETSTKKGWLPAKTSPSEIHVELMSAGLIPDPFVGFNEHKVQWIGQTEWLYTCPLPLPHIKSSVLELTFQGLDTLCDIYINRRLLMSVDNMFQTHVLRIPKDAIKSSDSHRSNVLLLHFKSAAKLAKELEAKMGRVRAGSTNLGDPSRVYVRKAQYGWRWDWGPELMTCGPYRPVILSVYNISIKDVNARALVSADLSKRLKVDVELCVGEQDLDSFTNTKKNLILRVWLKGKDGRVIRTAERSVRDCDCDCVIVNEESQGERVGSGVGVGIVNVKSAVDWSFGGEDDSDGDSEVKLWWPVGYGKQALYDVEVELIRIHQGEGEGGGEGEGSSELKIIVDNHTQRTGFRRIKLVQEEFTGPDQYGKGKSFLFEVNGVRMFMGGSNWIPASSFLTTLTDSHYRAWLTLLRDGNQNMVRIWGGGVYEPEVFYEICDELGLLIWQDFQFACGVYPAHSSFVQSVKKEAEDNVRIMRKHPCIALWCGNNEDYQMVLQWGTMTGRHHYDPSYCYVPHLPATHIYEHVLPSVVASLTGDPDPGFNAYGSPSSSTADPSGALSLSNALRTSAQQALSAVASLNTTSTSTSQPNTRTLATATATSTLDTQPATPSKPTPFPYTLSSDYQTPYHPGSPYGGVGWDTADPTVGDVHQWNVWGGKELAWQTYDRLGGRFVSEFGMPSMPCLKTIEAWMGKPRPKIFENKGPGSDWHAQSKIMAQHCRAGLFERRFAIAMNDNFRVTEDLEVAVFNTQMMQAESMAYAYSSWRRKWGTAGVLVWQSNDCWPVTSWAIADYFLRPKPAFFTIARQLAPIALGVTRTVVKNRNNDRPRQFYEFGAYQSISATLDVWGMNSTLKPVTGILKLHFVDISSNSDWEYEETIGSVTLPPNQSVDLLVGIPVRGPSPPPSRSGHEQAGERVKDGEEDYEKWTGCTSSNVVVGVRLVDEEKLNGGKPRVLARAADWPQPFRFVDTPLDPGLSLRVMKGKGSGANSEREGNKAEIETESETVTEIEISAKKPAKCVVLNVIGEGGGMGEVRWADNAFDLMPGDMQRVKVYGDLSGKEMEAAWFGNESAKIQAVKV